MALVFIYFCIVFFWLILATVLLLDQWLNLNLPWIPVPPANRSFVALVAFVMLLYSLMRCWTLWAQVRVRAKQREKNLRRPTSSQVVNPAFRFTAESDASEPDKKSDN